MHFGARGSNNHLASTGTVRRYNWILKVIGFTAVLFILSFSGRIERERCIGHSPEACTSVGGYCETVW